MATMETWTGKDALGSFLVRMWNGIGWKMAWGFFKKLHYLAILLCVPKKMVTLAWRLAYRSSNGRAQCLVRLAFGGSWGSIPRTTWPLNTASCGPGGLSSPFGARELDCRMSACHLHTGGWVQSTAPCGPLSSPQALCLECSPWALLVVDYRTELNKILSFQGDRNSYVTCITTI